jgi:hypothetical protein
VRKSGRGALSEQAMNPAGCYTAWAYFTYCRVVIYQKYAGKKPTIQHSIDL